MATQGLGAYIDVRSYVFEVKVEADIDGYKRNYYGIVSRAGSSTRSAMREILLGIVGTPCFAGARASRPPRLASRQTHQRWQTFYKPITQFPEPVGGTVASQSGQFRDSAGRSSTTDFTDATDGILQRPSYPCSPCNPW